jgi:hypothetical protein
MPRNIKLQVDPMKSFMRAEGDWCKTVSELSSAHLIGPASYSLGSSYLYFKAAAKACAVHVVVIRTSVV